MEDLRVHRLPPAARLLVNPTFSAVKHQEQRSRSARPNKWPETASRSTWIYRWEGALFFNRPNYTVSALFLQVLELGCWEDAGCRGLLNPPKALKGILRKRMLERAIQPLGDRASADHIMPRGSGVHFRCSTRFSRGRGWERGWGLGWGGQLWSRCTPGSFNSSWFLAFGALKRSLACVYTVFFSNYLKWGVYRRYVQQYTRYVQPSMLLFVH